MPKVEHWYRKTEHYLYRRKLWDAAIALLEAEIAAIEPSHGASYVQFSTDSNIDDSTQRCAILRTEGDAAKTLRVLKAQRDAVRAAKEKLTDEENTLIWLKYDLEKREREICRAMGLSRRAYFDMRKRALAVVAVGLGILE